ncbi:hypothetical protein AKJ38_03860 [candidate division MSBL1 archaeon SCGC-AAA259I14]|uniref:Uncharacterized protein n=1 Tax=candidate division MSBL1 archaeon SCGC-AAA259I14 TaxID=1698268 RepID=A0A133UPL3_9EURY|nr:hypothetical protein AKJ38_03860 [candidate division MSBL1 archaeon SCGC-AAA259I14]
MSVRTIRQKLRKIEETKDGPNNPGPLKGLKNDERSLRMFVTRTSKYISTGDKEAIAGILDGMLDKVNRVIDEHDLHPREYLTAISDFQSYVMSVTSVPKTSEIDKRFRNVLRALRKLERAAKMKELDEEQWTEEKAKEDREKATLTIQKGGEEEELEVEEATREEIEKSLELV